jgi:amino acid adenylation domain-containing protein
LLFTSGTTGKPKGVGITHANVLHYLDFVGAELQLRPDDRCSQTFDQTFDLSVHDVFVTWAAGASLHVPRAIDLLAPVRFIRKEALTCWFSVPSVVAVAMKSGALKPGVLPSLRYSLFCGEPLSIGQISAWALAAPGSVCLNLYGPTELTIACLLHRWDDEHSSTIAVNDVVPIGRPFAGLACLVVDEQLSPVQIGETGELLVCGPQTAPGYWQDVERTAERFVKIVDEKARTHRFYRTGDRVRRLAGGDYVFLGRTDHQIKVRGFRVELAEIEGVLLRDLNVAQAVVVGWPIVDGSAQRLLAFVTGAGINAKSLSDSCRASLPDYMVPESVRIVPEFPLNANGKVDRAALIERFVSTEAD